MKNYNLNRRISEMEVNGNALKRHLMQSQNSFAVKAKEIEKIASELETVTMKSLEFALVKQDLDGKLANLRILN